MHREDIKAAIRKRHSTLAAIARANGLDPSTLSKSLVQAVPAGERAIARFLGMSLHSLWPDRYALDGTPLRSRQDTIANSALRHRQKPDSSERGG